MTTNLVGPAAADAMRDVPEPVLKAVERLSRQPRVTVPDVAAAAGVDVKLAQDGLVCLASITGAAIDVTDEGELAYRFPRNIRQQLQQKSVRAAARMAWDRAFPVLFTAARVAFGAFLILSIVLIFVAILVLSTAGRSDDERNGSSRGGGATVIFGPRLFGPNIFDLIFYSRGGYSPYGYQQDLDRPATPKPGGMSFLESIYSFVFGDGDPNKARMTETRWKKVAAIIRANNGAVVAEQIAPLLDLPKSYEVSASVRESEVNLDEGFMLPVLQRFHGHPEVTDSGDLIYVFPDFGVTGSLRGGARAVDVVGTSVYAPLREEELSLSAASGSQQVIAGGLGALNLGGALTLGNMIANTVPLTRDSAAFLGAIKLVYPALLVYAVAFVLTPALRYLWIRRENRKIRTRNGRREQASLALARPSLTLASKMDAAKKYAKETRVVGSDSVLYSSDRDTLDQPSLERRASLDFDRRLEERGDARSGVDADKQ